MRLHKTINCSFCGLAKPLLYLSEIGGDPPAICAACVREAARQLGVTKDFDNNPPLAILNPHVMNMRYPWRDMIIGDHFLVIADGLEFQRSVRDRIAHAAARYDWLQLKFAFTENRIKVTRVG
jgi:hypothetical protein